MAQRNSMEKLLGKIHRQDCIEGMAALPEGSIDLAFADPPFNIGYDYDVYDDRRDCDDYLEWSHRWIEQVHRALKANGAFWLAIGDEYAAELKVAGQKIGFHCRSWVVWYYTFGVHCKSKFTRSHAHLFHFVKDPTDFVFNDRAIRVPSARQLVYNDARANPIGRMPDDTWILRPQDAVDAFDPDDDVWYFPRVAGTFKERAGFHGCQMPEQLLGRIIRACSHEGDVVMDPFTGSGTTLAVAKKLDRSFLGFELSKEYMQLASDRLAGIAVGDDLDGSEEPQVSAPSTASRAGRRKKNQQAHFSFASTRLDLDGLDEAASDLAAAFDQVNDGFSIDRVVADPAINEAFQAACESRSVPGLPRERNRALFRLRKSGQLARTGVVTHRRTNITWRHVSRFIFASEIAWRRISDTTDLSIDEILCDPAVAAQFDEIARGFAPGFMPLEYRWGALKLRKVARFARTRGAQRRLKQFDSLVPLAHLPSSAIPESPGVYAIRGADAEFLYVSEAANLRERITRHFEPDGTRAQWNVFSPKIQISHLRVKDLHEGRLAMQSLLVRRHKPELNIVSQLAGN